jgi:hypothetical protein
MGVKRKRKIKVDDINFKLAAATSRGTLVTYDTANDGFVRVPGASPAFDDKVVGLLMHDVVDKDLNAVPENRQKIEVPLSGFVYLAKEGEVGTDQIAAGAVFGAGSGVFLGANGTVTNVSTNERVGTALAAEDAQGFVDVYFDIN